MGSIDGMETYEEEALRLVFAALRAVLEEEARPEAKLAMIRRILPREPNPFLGVNARGF